MRRAIDEGIARRMELEQSLVVEEARRQEAEDEIAPLKESNLELTGKLQRAEDGLKAVDQVRARVSEAKERLQELERQVRDRDAKLELRAAALESLAPFPDRVVELEGQVGTLRREVDRLRDVELEAGEREAEMERLRNELAEQQTQASSFAEDSIRLRAAAETHFNKLQKAKRDGADKEVDFYLLSDHFQERMNKAFLDGALHSIRDGITAGWIDQEKMVRDMQAKKEARSQASAASGERGAGIVIREQAVPEHVSGQADDREAKGITGEREACVSTEGEVRGEDVGERGGAGE
ncbi:uncharacterized protein LOC133711950 [Rosa rugosa]|uniref:uncharacterized protein LOC133711950 n=1 Tax=Rosa rugosa TaxID=74645 RepID=UPI002B40A4E6|nr:uncharacterized protein LOC133711950 [Rosa rugosa]